MVRSQKARASLGESQELEVLWLDLKRLELLWVVPKPGTAMLRSQRAGTSMGKSQKLEILWLDLERLELLWANPKRRNFYD